MSEPSCPYGIQRVQQRSQWHQVTGRTKSPRMHLPDSEQHQETLSVSLSTLSAFPLLLLVNMHASNIQQNQAWAFVSVLCCVLYYAIIESQKRLMREATSEGKESGHEKVCIFLYLWGFKYIGVVLRLVKCVEFYLKEARTSTRVQLNPITVSQSLIAAFGSSLFNTRLITYFSSRRFPLTWDHWL